MSAVEIVKFGRWDFAGPAIFGSAFGNLGTAWFRLLAVALRTFGGPFGICLVLGIIQAGTVVACFLLTRRLFSDRVAGLATFLLLASNVVNDIFDHLDHNGIALIFNIAFLAALLRFEETGARRWLAVSFFMIGAACQFQAPMLFLLIVAAVARLRSPQRVGLVGQFAVVVSFFVPFVLFSGPIGPPPGAHNPDIVLPFSAGLSVAACFVAYAAEPRVNTQVERLLRIGATAATLMWAAIATVKSGGLVFFNTNVSGEGFAILTSYRMKSLGDRFSPGWMVGLALILLGWTARLPSASSGSNEGDAHARRVLRAGVLGAGLSCCVLFGIAGHRRYLLPAIVPFCIMAALGLERLFTMLQVRLQRRHSQLARRAERAGYFLLIGLCLVLLLPVSSLREEPLLAELRRMQAISQQTSIPLTQLPRCVHGVLPYGVPFCDSFGGCPAIAWYYDTRQDKSVPDCAEEVRIAPQHRTPSGDFQSFIQEFWNDSAADALRFERMERIVETGTRLPELRGATKSTVHPWGPYRFRGAKTPHIPPDLEVMNSLDGDLTIRLPLRACAACGGLFEVDVLATSGERDPERCAAAASVEEGSSRIACRARPAVEPLISRFECPRTDATDATLQLEISGCQLEYLDVLPASAPMQN
jgi:hypothetical protein